VLFSLSSSSSSLERQALTDFNYATHCNSQR